MKRLLSQLRLRLSQRQDSEHGQQIVRIVLISLIAWLLYAQKLDGPALAGIALIGVGIVVLNFSKSAAH